MSRTRRTLVAAGWGVAALLAVGLVVTLLPPGDLTASGRLYLTLAGVAFFGAVFMPHVGVAALLLAGGAAAGRRWRLATAFGLLAVAWLAGPAWDARPRTPAGGPAELRVMAFNLHYLNDDAAAVLAEVRRWGPDVIVMNETSAPLFGELNAALAAEYPHRKTYNIFAHADIRSRLPLTVPPGPWADHGVQQGRECVVLEVGGEEVALFGVHLVSPTRPGMIGLNRRQAAELEAAVEAELARGRSVIVAGDHNVPPNSANAAALYDAGLTTSFDAAGGGRAGTWPSHVPAWLGVRIDHVWVSGRLAVTAHHVGDPAGSDHRPVIADLRLAR